MSKNEKLLESFTEYCKKYPELRFWQALCFWSGQHAIIAKNEFQDKGLIEHRDTFYWENKDN